ALGDEQAGVRRHAIRLSEPLLGKSAKVSFGVLKHVEESDPTIRLQMAYSLGEWHELHGALALGKIAVAGQGDPYITAAVMSSLNKENVGTVLAAVMGGSGKQPPAERLVERLLAVATALGDDDAMVKAVATITQSKDGKFAAWQFTALAGMLDVTARRKQSLDQKLDDKLRGQVVQTFQAARDAVAAGRGDDKPAQNKRL